MSFTRKLFIPIILACCPLAIAVTHAQTATQVVEPALAAAVSTGREASYLVYLKETADLSAAVATADRDAKGLTAYRALKPGGILLATFPTISQVSRYDVECGWGDYWRFTSFAVKRMLSEIFPEDNVQLETHGNILTAAAFLFGLSSPELTERELEEVDPEFVMLVTARAQKPLS